MILEKENLHNKKAEIEDAQIIEETLNMPVIKTGVENAEVIDNKEYVNSKFNEIKNTIIEGVLKNKIDKTRSKLSTDSENIETEKFRSEIAPFNFKDVEIPKNHPLMPVLMYAKKILEKNQKGSYSLGSISNGNEKLDLPIESALRKVFYPIYGGDGKIPKSVPENVRDILNVLFVASDDKSFKTKFSKASFDLISNLGSSMNKSNLESALIQFQEELI